MHFRRLVAISVFSVCCFGGLPHAAAQKSAPAADDPKGPDKVFVGYVFRQPRKINYELYTHLCHAFVTANEDGKIRPNKACPSRQLVADAHKAKVKVLISLGGWGWDKQFSAIVSKADAEDRYVQAVMKIVDEYDYDGIDLDWEYPNTKDKVVGFDRLSRRFRKALDELGQKKGRHLLQTMAASASPSTLKWLSNKLLLETMDWINVMTYDYAGDWSSYAGHHSPLFASSKQPGAPQSIELSLKYLVNRGMPANRLAVGLPLYGRGFAVAEPYAATKKGAKAVKAGSYNDIDKLIKDKGWTRRWDNETKTPWAIAPDGSAVIGYDDAESLSLKTDWAMKQGFRGVFFWQISDDLRPDGTNLLQAASHKKWEENTRPAKLDIHQPAPLQREGAPPPRKKAEVDAFLKAIERPRGPLKKLHILLAAGPKDHGVDEHDYPLWQRRWLLLLQKSPDVEADASFGWPSPLQWKTADVIVFYSHHAGWSADKAKDLDAFLERGGGLVYLHWATAGLDATEVLAERIGLAVDKIKYRHGPLDVEFDGKHPITKGFAKVHFVDESYWNLTGDPSQIQVLGSCIEEGKPRPLFWTREQGKGRVFVSLPGHYTWTFDDPLFRILVLRGVSWASREPIDRLSDLAVIGARMAD